MYSTDKVNCRLRDSFDCDCGPNLLAGFEPYIDMLGNKPSDVVLSFSSFSSGSTLQNAVSGQNSCISGDWQISINHKLWNWQMLMSFPIVLDDSEQDIMESFRAIHSLDWSIFSKRTLSSLDNFMATNLSIVDYLPFNY